MFSLFQNARSKICVGLSSRLVTDSPFAMSQPLLFVSHRPRFSLFCWWSATSNADEGMWLFNAPPAAQLKAKYGFEPTAPWLEHLQKASVRFQQRRQRLVRLGGRVNHHKPPRRRGRAPEVRRRAAQLSARRLSTPLPARTRNPCLDLELNVLMSIEDVTARVKAAVKPEMSASDALAARRAVSADIEKESQEKTGLRSDVITLYQGGEYQLYRFKRYTDVRLVFAPEQGIAFLRRRPGQLRVSPFRSGYLHLPRLRERPARASGTPSPMERERSRRPRVDLCQRPPRFHEPGKNARRLDGYPRPLRAHRPHAPLPPGNPAAKLQRAQL